MSFSCQVLANYLIKYLIAVSWWSNEGAARRCCSSPRAAVLGSAKKPSIHLPPPPPLSRSALPGQRRGGCRRSLRLCRPRSALLASLWGCPPPAACFPGAPAGTGGSGRRGGGAQGAAPCRGNAGSCVRGDGGEPPRGPPAPRPAVRSSSRPSGKPLPPSRLRRGGCRAAERCLRRRWKPG